ncbi:MAG: serine/threonine protein kinase [Cyanobacteria bacterium]|nr:serine/threonine protein kinase [Cyanobacteriota bacterium]
MFAQGDILRDRYRLDSKLSTSPQRESWLAEDVGDGTYVTVKLLPVGGTTRWEDIKLIEREAQILEVLHHPRIPQFRDYFALDDADGPAGRGHWFALVTTYIPGQSLQQQLARGHSFAIAEVRAILEAVLEILAMLHDRRPPLLHRDIKPSNLVRGEDGEIYLIDFGSVQVRPRDLGATFTVAGTYGYTPIEQFGAQAVPASDLYALGMTAVHLLTGQSPASLPHKNLRVQFHDQLPKRCPEFLVQWLDRVTAADAEERFVDGAAALAALRRGPAISRGLSSRTGAIADPSRAMELPRLRRVKLSRSSSHLVIEVPSQFTVTYWQPFLDKIRAIGPWLRRGRDRWQQLDATAKTYWIVGGAIALFLLALVTPGGLPMVIASLLALPIKAVSAVLSLLFPLLLTAYLVSAISAGAYFESTALFFTEHHCDRYQRGLFGRHPLRVKLTEVAGVHTVPVVMGSGQVHSGLILDLHPHAKLPPGGEAIAAQAIGTHLTEEEVLWLGDEIQSWLIERAHERAVRAAAKDGPANPLPPPEP